MNRPGESGDSGCLMKSTRVTGIIPAAEPWRAEARPWILPGLQQDFRLWPGYRRRYSLGMRTKLWGCAGSG